LYDVKLIFFHPPNPAVTVGMPPPSITSAAHKVDTVVIGAGVIGSAVARALVAHTKSAELLLLDRALTFGTETSSRNSEVIHAGIYYPTNSLKSKLCVQGKRVLYDYCQERNIPFRRCGKLVVANTEPQVAKLHQLQQQAQRNGVSDTELLSSEQVYQRVPLVQATHGALWSPSTGIVDSHALMEQLLWEIQNPSCDSVTTTVAFHSNVQDGFITSNTNVHDHRIHLCVDDDFWLSCRRVVNCAGLWATRIASLLHQHQIGKDSWQPVPQYFCRGTYFRIQGHAPPKFQHLIYPVPDPNGGLGVHATMDLQGQIKFGPDVEWLGIATESPDQIDMQPDASRATQFYSSIRTYWPELPDDALVPDYSGIRPKLGHPSLLFGSTGVPFHDFHIAGPAKHHIPGLVHLFGMESPGLTSALAIGDHVAQLLGP
jgi:L-2-hydroxyglutarate oxidase LhgO